MNNPATHFRFSKSNVCAVAFVQAYEAQIIIVDREDVLAKFTPGPFETENELCFQLQPRRRPAAGDQASPSR